MVHSPVDASSGAAGHDRAGLADVDGTAGARPHPPIWVAGSRASRRTVVAAVGFDPGRGDEDGHAAAALGAEPGRVERAAAAAVALARGAATPGAVHQIALDRTPIGMRRSSSICRSSSGERPSVVR